MSIKALAQELYKAQQKVQRLEREREQATRPDDRKRIEDDLQAAIAEQKQLRKMLDGAKAPDPAADRTPGRYGS